MYKNVIFDLDGTIIQSHPGIINAVRYALERLKLPMPSEEVIFSRIGPPLGETFLFLGVKKGRKTTPFQSIGNITTKSAYMNAMFMTEYPNSLKS